MPPPIVMLHQVSDDTRLDSLKPYSISSTSFLRLLDFLEERQIQTTTFSALLSPRHPHERKEKKIILTFDDCAKSLFDLAVPELKKRNMQAVFFMPTASIAGYNDWDADLGRAKVPLMNEAELRSLSLLGMEIGSHAHHHIKMRDIQSFAELVNEVQTSKEKLEQITSAPVYSFAYPFGSVPKGYKKLLRNAGYKFGVSIFHPVMSRWALRRFIYHDGDTRDTLSKKLTIYYTWYRSLTDMFKPQ
jgi:peptidoglycan/xylan/chitin deacetylase (PgdA/CDA1 family)